jgi:hypothetical protein
VVVPALLGCGERLFEHLAGYEVVESVTSPSALHVQLART